MAYTKITKADTENKGVVGLPDTPNLSTMEMQQKFDELVNDVVIPKFNELSTELDDLETDKLPHSNDITDFKLDNDGKLQVSTDGGNTFNAAGSSGHLIVDGSGTTYPSRSRLQFSQNVVIRDYDENNGNKTFLSIAGQKGDPGESATIRVGDVSRGDEPEVNNVGSAQNAIFDFVLPQGDKGDAASISVGTVSSGDSPSVSNRGTSSDAIFDFILPKGEKGDPGTGLTLLDVFPTLADLQAAHPTGQKGDAYLVGDSVNNTTYLWSTKNNVWEDVGALKGAKGDSGEAGTITIGTVTESLVPTVENVGTSTNAILNFGLQKGIKGDTGNAGTISVGRVTSGDNPIVTNVGTNTNAIFDFVIPKGDKGDKGEPTVVNGKSSASITLYGTDIQVSADDPTPLSEFSGGSKTYTKAEWEALDKSKLKDGDVINISDDYVSNICPTIAECEASTNVDDIAGASAVKEINGNLGGLKFGIDGEGTYGYFKADGSFNPFKSGATYGIASEFSSTVGTIYPVPSQTRRANMGVDGNNFVIQEKGTYYFTFALATTTNSTAKRFNIWKNDTYIVQGGTAAYYSQELELDVGDKIRGNCTNSRGGIITLIKID